MDLQDETIAEMAKLLLLNGENDLALADLLKKALTP